MKIPTMCIYKNEIPYLLVYNGKVDKIYIDNIEQILNSDKWKELNPPVLSIETDSKMQLFFRTMTNYIYVIICDDNCNSKIYEFIDKINNFVELKSINNFYSYAKNFDEMIDTFYQEENRIEKIQKQIKDVTNTMTDAISNTIDRQGKLDNLEEKTNNLKDSAKKFENSSAVLKRNIMFRNMKIILAIGSIILFIIIIAVIIATV
jgi:vesicle-associated membrane protein 4